MLFFFSNENNLQTYNECLQLQLQLNLAQRAIHRLQTSLGISTDAIDETVDTSVLLAQVGFFSLDL